MASPAAAGGELDPQKLAPELKDESSPSTSSAANPTSNGRHHGRLSPAASDPAPTLDGGSAGPELKRRRTEASPEETKGTNPAAAAAEDSRRLFQRLWTDEDEIAILQGFMAFTASQRSGGAAGPSSHHQYHDTGAFYDQIRASIRLDFNKNQLVEKLRRLKKKYRNIATKIRSGKDYAFKSAHDQVAFDLSSKIWGAGAGDDDDDDDDDRSGRYNRKGATAVAAAPLTAAPPPSPVPASNIVEETMKSCLSPMFKELLRCASPGGGGLTGLSLGLSPLPFGLGGGGAAAQAPNPATEARWRRQQILELEVFSRRIDLMQEQIKLLLADLRSRR